MWISNFVLQTKLNIGDHDYEYPAAPANGKAHHADKETYQELQQTKQQQQSPTYEPLATASEKEVRVKIEPDDGPTVMITIVVIIFRMFQIFPWPIEHKALVFLVYPASGPSRAEASIFDSN